MYSQSFLIKINNNFLWTSVIFAVTSVRAFFKLLNLSKLVSCNHGQVMVLYLYRNGTWKLNQMMVCRAHARNVRLIRFPFIGSLPTFYIWIQCKPFCYSSFIANLEDVSESQTGIEPATFWSPVRSSNLWATRIQMAERRLNVLPLYRRVSRSRAHNSV